MLISGVNDNNCDLNLEEITQDLDYIAENPEAACLNLNLDETPIVVVNDNGNEMSRFTGVSYLYVILLKTSDLFRFRSVVKMGQVVFFCMYLPK